ncbi:DNA-binding transcriptional MerR regulator [Enemella evansiae]|nr:DNA-binding transcriptional MerR regulator [Enemella evansiae]
MHELAARAGISGRTLRHYHRIGLLEPDRIGSNGYRFYGPVAVARLQRILLLRDTGMSLADIASVVDAADSTEAEVAALEMHLGRLAHERAVIDRRTRAVEHTLAMRRAGREPRMEVMLDGFNDRYEDEVVSRWGREAFDAADRWWHDKNIDQRRRWQREAEALLSHWGELCEAGHAVDSEPVREQTRAHLDWLAAIPGTPTHSGDAERSRKMICGLTDLYESEPDFHGSFGGRTAAEYAARALRSEFAADS